MAFSLILAAGGCSSDKPVTEAELSQRFQTNAKLDKAFSDCLADRLFAATGTDKLDDNDKLALKKDEAAKDITKLLATKVTKAKQACAKKGITPS